MNFARSPTGAINTHAFISFGLSMLMTKIDIIIIRIITHTAYKVAILRFAELLADYILK